LRLEGLEPEVLAYNANRLERAAKNLDEIPNEVAR